MKMTLGFVDCWQASVRCLAPFGSLLEIGKYDMVKGTMLPMRDMLRGVNYQAILLEELLDEGPSGNPAKVWDRLHCWVRLSFRNVSLLFLVVLKTMRMRL